MTSFDENSFKFTLDDRSLQLPVEEEQKFEEPCSVQPFAQDDKHEYSIQPVKNLGPFQLKDPAPSEPSTEYDPT